MIKLELMDRNPTNQEQTVTTTYARRYQAGLKSRLVAHLPAADRERHARSQAAYTLNIGDRVTVRGAATPGTIIWKTNAGFPGIEFGVELDDGSKVRAFGSSVRKEMAR